MKISNSTHKTLISINCKKGCILFHLQLVSSSVHYSAVKGARNCDCAHENIVTATGFEIQCSFFFVCLCQVTSSPGFCTGRFTRNFFFPATDEPAPPPSGEPENQQEFATGQCSLTRASMPKKKSQQQKTPQTADNYFISLL